MITLKSSDDKFFEIHESVAKQSKTIQRMMMDDDDDCGSISMHINVFPVQLPSDILAKVIEYCKRHADPVVAADDKLYEIESNHPSSDQSSSSSSSESSSTIPAVDELKCHVAVASAADENSKSPEIDLNQPSSSSSASSSAVPVAEEDLKTFDENFVKVDWNLLMSITNAANFLEIKGLFDLTCQAAAKYIQDKTPEEVRVLFDIENDFTPEEEAEIRKENAWAFE